MKIIFAEDIFGPQIERTVKGLKEERGLICNHAEANLFTGTVRYKHQVTPVWVYYSTALVWSAGEPPYEFFKPKGEN